MIHIHKRVTRRLGGKAVNRDTIKVSKEGAITLSKGNLMNFSLFIAGERFTIGTERVNGKDYIYFLKPMKGEVPYTMRKKYSFRLANVFGSIGVKPPCHIKGEEFKGSDREGYKFLVIEDGR